MVTTLSCCFRKRFGNLVEVRGDKYDLLIDKSPPGVIVIIHIYSEVSPNSILVLFQGVEYCNIL